MKPNSHRTIIAIEHDENLDFLAPILALAGHGRTISVLRTEVIGYHSASATHVEPASAPSEMKALPKPRKTKKGDASYYTAREKLKRFDQLGLPWYRNDQNNVVIDVPKALSMYKLTREGLLKGSFPHNSREYMIKRSILRSEEHEKRKARAA